ncbi:MAG TPA: BTAD domain-containing putative transcriptional regulator [Mycobacterium sp.]|nr:BTAD domain-containing putative transcriptional regulator [Mycobacterium sp.]
MLGPLEVEVDGVPVELGGPVPRRLLAALSVAAGAPVSDDALAELVWGSNRPSDIAPTLRVVVYRLRASLGSGGMEALRRTGQGYAFAVGVCDTDHGRFAELVDAGMQALRDGGPEAAAASLEAALRLWRGEPWVELGDAVAVSAARSKLNELRDTAVEELQAARLACGDTARAIAALTEAVTESPYRERRWELLALALYRTGRQTHALAELRRVRQLFIDELGIEPGRALRDLEQRMLGQDRNLLLVETAPQSPHATERASTPPRTIAKPTTALFGREQELAILGGLLQDHRLVTVTGPAGVGKTRLAIEYAAAQSDAWLVRLADVHSVEAVAPAIAAAIGLTYVAWDPMLAIQRAVADRPGLLILDNCEHLSDSVAQITVGLLASCRQVRILTTSRRSLNAEAEYVLPLPPLPIATGGADGPAVGLLLNRVGSNRPDWRPSTNDRKAAREICSALDGLPLAIELAAARERACGLEEIAAHLRHRLDILGETPRGSISPHRSLQAAISWSIDQLPTSDRALLLRLWPFEGGFTWQAAEAVHDVTTVAPVLATLAALVDRSVVVSDLSAGRPRYRMLETIRRYCESVDPDPVATREAHAAWVRTFAAEKASLLTGHHCAEALRALESELANIRAGIVHDLEHNPTEALRTTGALYWMWVTIGAIHDGDRLIRAALEACPDAAVEDRARGLIALSRTSFHGGDSELALQLANDALASLENSADSHEELFLEAHSRKCNALADLDRLAELREAAARFKAESDRCKTPDYLRACALFGIGVVQARDGDPAGAAETFTESRRISARCGFISGEGISEVLLAWANLRQSPRSRATTLHALQGLSRAVRTFERQPNVSDALGALYAGAFALADLGEPAVAGTLRAAVIEHAGRVGTDPRRYAGPDIDARLDKLLGDAMKADAAPMSWSAMIELFTETVERLTAS